MNNITNTFNPEQEVLHFLISELRKYESSNDAMHIKEDENEEGSLIIELDNAILENYASTFPDKDQTFLDEAISWLLTESIIDATKQVSEQEVTDGE